LKLIERYNIEVERAAKHGRPVPISIEQAYIELVDPELGETTKTTKSKLFPSTAKWPKVESAKKQRALSAKVQTQEPTKPVSVDDQCPKCKQSPAKQQE
jgi:hypothetical protein